jgi:diphthine methyl ester acylhydrolase
MCRLPSPNDENPYLTLSRTTVLTQVVSGAVLDLHFAPRNQNIFAVAQSNGVLSLWHLAVLGGDAALRHLGDLEMSDSSILILSLAWDPSSSEQYQIGATLSDGCTSVITLDSDWNVAARVSIVSHRLEAWTLAWSLQLEASAGSGPGAEGSGAQLYCGGDDAAICRWEMNMLADDSTDKRAEAERYLVEEVPEQRLKGTTPYSPGGLLFDTATHDAGVTAILPLVISGQETIVTGSYDEFIRVMSPRRLGRWNVKAERRLGGGVWRLKLLQRRAIGNGLAFTVLASCMHAGSRIVNIWTEAGEWSIDVVARFEEHESMNYGSDSTQTMSGEGSDQHIVVSTSFYDRRLCVWKTGCG